MIVTTAFSYRKCSLINVIDKSYNDRGRSVNLGSFRSRTLNVWLALMKKDGRAGEEDWIVTRVEKNLWTVFSMAAKNKKEDGFLCYLSILSWRLLNSS